MALKPGDFVEQCRTRHWPLLPPAGYREAIAGPVASGKAHRRNRSTGSWLHVRCDEVWGSQESMVAQAWGTAEDGTVIGGWRTGDDTGVVAPSSQGNRVTFMITPVCFAADNPVRVLFDFCCSVLRLRARLAFFGLFLHQRTTAKEGLAAACLRPG